MHKTPYRPTNDVTQPFEDGIVRIYTVTDANEGTGLLPKDELTEVIKLPYDSRKLGVQRYYSALQNQIMIQRVIRVPVSNVKITSQDIAITEDGEQYRIDLVQAVATYPPSEDLTLVKYEQKQEVSSYD